MTSSSRRANLLEAVADYEARTRAYADPAVAKSRKQKDGGAIIHEPLVGRRALKGCEPGCAWRAPCRRSSAAWRRACNASAGPATTTLRSSWRRHDSMFRWPRCLPTAAGWL